MNEKLRKILQRKKEIRAKLNAQIEGTVELTDEEIKALQGELENLNEEEEAAVEEAEQDEQRKKAEELTKRSQNGNIQLRRIAKPGEEIGDQEEERELTPAEKRQRGKDLKEQRAITVGSSEIIAPRHTAEGLTKTFNEVSTLVDLVKVTPLNGGEAYQRGYVAGYGEGGAQDDNTGDYEDVETTFNYADINKQEITAYQEQPKAVKKLADAAYGDEIVKGIGISIKKKLSKAILTGYKQIVGIFQNPNKFAINQNTDIGIASIDENTLDEIVYTYGGDEDVENDAALILNKKDLKAFKKVRYSDGKKVYEIVNNGNTGTIDGIPFVINSACKAISDTTTNVDDYCMAYGSLSNYELAVFSDLEVEESNDYKFKQGQIAHRGDGFFGGNVVAKNGFVRVKKAAAQVDEG